METAIENPEPSPALTPFQRWLEPARQHAKLWRTILGFVLVFFVWIVWTLVVVALAVVQRVSQNGFDTGSIEALVGDLTSGASPADVMVLLATFWGIWFGVWLAATVCHERKVKTIIAPPGGFRWIQFGHGVLIVGVYLLLGTGLGLLTGSKPYRSDLPINEWLVWLAPVGLMIFIQSTAEEAFFRGYLVQNLAARFRSALIWGLVPAVLFGIGHYAGNPNIAFTIYYIVSTVLFALIATAVVWRTGSLATVMGMHVANNLIAFLVAGPDESMNSTQLWLWSTHDLVASAPFDLASLVLMLLYVLSPWAPFEGRPLIGRRKETRAAP